tara:strand:- start:174 stop:647 length:474 start_codon:yes stop_codon:yes gene_type:complete
MFKKKKIILLALFLLVTACGFKVLDKSQLIDFKIENIETSGDKKINFFIKNNLSNKFSALTGKKSILLNIKTTKTKSIKEKNIKNQITKYEIKLNTVVEIDILGETQKNLVLNVGGNYDVATNHSTTINNQNNLEKNLAERASSTIVKKLILLVNDF